MTWQAQCKIEDISDGPAPIDVLATANGPEEIQCNTEGKIIGIGIKFQLDCDETSLKIGDVITVGGHFTNISGGNNESIEASSS